MAIKATKYWQTEKSNRVKCTLCPRFCTLKEGQRGLCFVRGNENNKIVLHTYGRSSGFCIDPIEKKPLNHFYPGSPVLSFGTAGCNLSCAYCQNWDISKARDMDKLQSEATPEAIVMAAKKHLCKSIAFTYNDPVIFLEYARDVSIEAKKSNIKTVAVTAGYICEEPRKEFFSFIDATNVDLKSFSNNFYRDVAKGDLSTVLDTLVYIKENTNTWLEITTLIVPGKNDSTSELTEMVKWINQNLGKNVPIHFTAFHPDYKMQNIPRTSREILNKAYDIAKAEGLSFVYTGNVHDPTRSSTYCPGCNKLLIQRDWFELGEYNISKAKCSHCSTKLPGHFDNFAGSWGSKRQPINI